MFRNFQLPEERNWEYTSYETTEEKQDQFSEKNKSNNNADEAESVAASKVECNSNKNMQNLTEEPHHSLGAVTSMDIIQS